MKQSSLTFVATLFGATSASPRRRQETGSPCAEVSASASSILAAAPTATPVVDGQLAYDCLNSVPINQQNALDLYDSVIQFVYWQTGNAPVFQGSSREDPSAPKQSADYEPDLNYLKDPPSGYLEPAVDIFAELAAVGSKIEDSTYSNEYEFQADIFRVFNLAHDGHFRFFPDLLTGVIHFNRGVGLVSVSQDGIEIPQIYTHSDVILSLADPTFEPSVVTAVNEIDAIQFLEDLSQLGALNDPDALYNALFFTLPFSVSQAWDGYFAGSGRFGNIWPGSTTTLAFENGTSIDFRTTANVIADFTDVTDGQSAYEVFCVGAPGLTNIGLNATATTSATAPPTSTATQAAAPGPSGYPEPVVISSDLQVAGYYLDGENSDTAVLAMVSFDPTVPAEFQAVIQAFLANAKASGKTKLVIDLSANGGGLILAGYDTFRQLFPQIVQKGYTRFLESDAFNVIAEIFSAVVPADYDPETATLDELYAYETPFNYRYDLNITNEHFPDFESKFAPRVYEGFPYTNLLQWDLNDPLTTINSTYGIGEEITGYGTRTNFTQPFAAEDIVMLYDGYCASTCTIFSEFMRLQGGVKSISVGGRPVVEPMQTLGGTKGANNYGFGYIWSLALNAYYLRDASPNTDLTPLSAINDLAYARSTDSSINVRDSILPQDVSEGLPSQFVYEPADCRLFYTPESVTDITATWNAAANAAFKNAPCAVGGITTDTSRKRKRAPTFPTKRAGLSLADMNFEMPEKTMDWVARHGQKVPV